MKKYTMVYILKGETEARTYTTNRLTGFIDGIVMAKESGDEIIDVSIEEVKITKEEKELMQLHKDNYSGLQSAEIVKVWRDDDGYLCVRYDNEEWYHYNAVDGAWW